MHDDWVTHRTPPPIAHDTKHPPLSSTSPLHPHTLPLPLHLSHSFRASTWLGSSNRFVRNMRTLGSSGINQAP